MKGGGMIAARVQIPGLRGEPVIARAHVINPLTFYGKPFEECRRAIAAAKERMAGLADAACRGAVIVGGDINSTPNMRQFRDLLSNGYRDAVEQTGAGSAPPFPSYPVFPTLVTIDHVLTRHATVSSIRTIDLPGSDHRALLATVELPRGHP